MTVIFILYKIYFLALTLRQILGISIFYSLTQNAVPTSKLGQKECFAAGRGGGTYTCPCTLI